MDANFEFEDEKETSGISREASLFLLITALVVSCATHVLLMYACSDCAFAPLRGEIRDARKWTKELPVMQVRKMDGDPFLLEKAELPRPAAAPDAASLPFDARRGGFVMGEGSGVLVLEELEHARARGAHIYAEVVGYGANCDAYHFTAPAPGGAGAIDCMKLTLADAGITPEQVDHINAHGTGTHMNDACETAAIHAVFGEHAKQLTVVSTKSMTGHLLGGAGGIEAVFTALALRDQFAPPTIHYQQPDPECDLDYVPNTGRAQAMTYALSNSLGFGGHNACIALRRWEG